MPCISLCPPASVCHLDQMPSRLQIFGIKYGLRGFYDRATKPVHLTPETVDGIQLRGGTILVRPPLCCASCVQLYGDVS